MYATLQIVNSGAENPLPREVMKMEQEKRHWENACDWLWTCIIGVMAVRMLL